MITKQQVLQNGVNGDYGLGGAVKRMSTGVQRGCFVYHFSKYEVPDESIDMLQQLLSAAGWNASISKVKVNEGDYRETYMVDRIKVVLS